MDIYPLIRMKDPKKLKNEVHSKNYSQSQIFIETPYRNQSLFDELIKVLNNNTFLLWFEKI